MKNTSLLLLLILVLNSCQQQGKSEKSGEIKKIEYLQLVTPEYQLERPHGTASAVLVLFGGYPEVAEDIKREFTILEQAKQNSIAVLYLNYNQKLWFEENELGELAKKLQDIFTFNKLATDNIYLGGFSSGGVVTALLGNHLAAHQEMKLSPKGVFIVDSPIDLAELYFTSEKNLEREFSDVAIQESTWLITKLGSRFGNPNTDIEPYERHSVFTSKTGSTRNIQHLVKTKVRLYTEPDTLWWQQNRRVDFEQTNAYLIKELSEKLQTEGFTEVEYIPTVDKGYRANGERHPHSWAIVDQEDLINWMIKP